MKNIPSLRLNDGQSIPQIGLGLWQVTNEEEFNRAFDSAVAAGYRHFDTAQIYGNEQMLGAALKRSNLKREDVFITTKIAFNNFGENKSRRSVEASLKRLDSDYIDLLLLHFPVPALRKKTWKVAEDIKRQGLARSIGVSNYTISHLKQLENYADILPAVNQVEMHIFLQQAELREYLRDKGIVIEAYSPLAHGKVMANPVVGDLAKKHGVSYAQIMLRWALDQRAVIIPKSIHPERIKENLAVLDFELDKSDLDLLSQQDKHLHTCWNPELVP